jgi:serine/threonine protein kinase
MSCLSCWAGALRASRGTGPLGGIGTGSRPFKWAGARIAKPARGMVAEYVLSTRTALDNIYTEKLGMESTIGPYRLLRKISRGGMGSVYEAVHSTIERRVAIKVLDAGSGRGGDMATRFLNEARAVNRVNDPGLVQMFDHGLLRDGTAYIVMEYLEGETLSRRLRRMGRRMPVQDILRLMRQTAETLCATHQKGIIHRVLKHTKKPSRNRDLIWGV